MKNNIYGFVIKASTSKRQFCYFYKKIFSHYPQTNEIYALIEDLREYIHTSNAVQLDSPMLNIYTFNSNSFQAMVAIPISHDISSKGDIQLKKFVLGNLITTRVKGGIHTIIKSEHELKNYFDDHHLLSPAASYQLLLTNRMQETDTSKWITEVCYPVY